MISLIITAPVTYAEKCRYEENRIDDFTGEKILSTKWELFHLDVGVKGVTEAAGITRGENKFLAIRMKREDTLSYELFGDELRNWFVVPEGASLLILLADDTVVELAAQKEVTGISRSSSANKQLTESSELEIRYKIRTSATIPYTLDANSYAALTAQAATHMRMSTAKGDHDFRVDKKLTDAMQKALLCLKQETI